ncbi:TBC1 domain family member 5 [Schistocerca serialis cubense]|uniref:TBC1 domain family member 5 n=1 Tax=Schistocerca serialis cubense TaxID=2023355 RepID=UPI00214E9399|nr:TBC1 domain family member 5 [Schistocerca serialis cubense]
MEETNVSKTQGAPKMDSEPMTVNSPSHSIAGAEEESSERTPESVTDETSADSSEKSASILKYEEEWAALCHRDDPGLEELRRRAVLGSLRASRFRSVCWRALLGVLPTGGAPPHGEAWLGELRRSRQHYARLCAKLAADPWKDNDLLVRDDPLSQSSESIWHQYFCDKELRALIRQDVVRTFPGVDFFRKQMIQDAMVNILFCYAREHPQMCYRQGMHEILAPLLFVLHCDHQALLHTKEQVQVSDEISEILNPKFLEEDAYAIFSRIIGGIASCYRINDLTPTATGYFPANLQTPSPDGGSGRSENEVVAQLNWIRDRLLAPKDPQLHQHLQQLDIPLPLFGIRWLRLLFGREFPLQDLLVLWDAIFAEGQDFELVNYIVVAMLIAIRHQLLSSDYTACLTYLMRYPGAVDISYIIDHALHLKDPDKYSEPAITSFPTLPNVTVGGRADLNRGAAAGHTHEGQFCPPKQRRPGHRQQQHHHHHYRSSTVPPGDKGGDVEIVVSSQVVVRSSEKAAAQLKKGSAPDISTLSGRLKKLSSRSGRWGGPSKGSQTKRDDADAGIVDGYALDDPLLLYAELHHARSIMALCRLKLEQYHSDIKKAILPTEHPDVAEALNGILELCALLTSRQGAAPAEVEPALEAGELHAHAQAQPAGTEPPRVSSVLPQPTGGYRRSAAPPAQLPLGAPAGSGAPPVGARGAQPQPRDVQMKVFREHEGSTSSVEGAPVENPLAAAVAAACVGPEEQPREAADKM